jgi:hypothetical protein
MSIWNKVLIGLVIVVGLAYLVFAATALKARSYWGQSIQKHEEALAAIARDKELLMDGVPAENKPGVRQLAQEVHRMVIGRGRVWRGTVPKLVKGEEVTVATQLPAPHAKMEKTQLFVFQDATAQSLAVFLGEFSVVAVGGPQLWQLQSVRPMTEAERDRLRRSRGPWSMYELMPGEPMEGDAAGIDFYVLLSDYYRQRAYLDDLIAATTADAQAVENADTSAKAGNELLEKDKASLGEEIKAMRAERDLVAKHLADLEANIALRKDAAQKTELANRAAASELARLQLEAIRRIDQRTSKVARAAETY